MKNTVLIAVCLLCVCSLLSCTRISGEGIMGRLLILEGNFLSSRQRYNEAIVSYNRAAATEEASPYAEAGLASAYASLDENTAALERLEYSRQILAALPSAEHRELRYRNSFNKGVLHFVEGEFPQAAECFREALRIDSARLEAKRNLELSLLSVAGQKAGKGQSAESPEEAAAKTVLFEYLSRKEQSQWESREWAAEEENTGPDY